jgi:hypothetical protein
LRVQLQQSRQWTVCRLLPVLCLSPWPVPAVVTASYHPRSDLRRVTYRCVSFAYHYEANIHFDCFFSTPSYGKRFPLHFSLTVYWYFWMRNVNFHIAKETGWRSSFEC